MSALRMPLLGLLVGLLLGWIVQGWQMRAELLGLRAEHAAQLQQIAEASAAAMAEQQQARQALEARLQTIDANKHRELTDAQENSARLAAELRSATRRLSVRAACPAGGEVPEAAGAADLGNGADRAELHPETAADLVGIAGDADQCAVKLAALQGWAREVSGGKARPAD